jgi:DNA-binding transcriptional MocR family regulator
LKYSQQISCNIFQYIPKSRQMSAEERQKRIETYLKQVEFAALEELAKQVNASVSTVRRDLTLMETTGVLKRTHGGARLAEPPSSDEFNSSSQIKVSSSTPARPRITSRVVWKTKHRTSSPTHCPLRIFSQERIAWKWLSLAA